jgi:hypothetical protein
MLAGRIGAHPPAGTSTDDQALREPSRTSWRSSRTNRCPAASRHFVTTRSNSTITSTSRVPRASASSPLLLDVCSAERTQNLCSLMIESPPSAEVPHAAGRPDYGLAVCEALQRPASLTHSASSSCYAARSPAQPGIDEHGTELTRLQEAGL